MTDVKERPNKSRVAYYLLSLTSTCSYRGQCLLDIDIDSNLFTDLTHIPKVEKSYLKSK